MKILLTGAAGFIGFHTTKFLCRKNLVVGIDNLNNYYDVKLKKMLKPGDVMEITVSLLEKMGSAWSFQGKVRSNGKVAASCEFLCSIIEKE